MSVLLLLCVCVIGCGMVSAEPVRVFVSLAPQLECVERLGGERVHAEALLPRGSSPEMYTPVPGQITAIGRSQLFIPIGVPFETRLIEKLTKMFPELKIHSGTQGMIFREEGAGEVHAHGHEAEHAHAHHGHDPHVWMSPELMKCHARNVAEALTALLPAHREDIARRLEAYCAELDALDSDIRAELAPFRGREAVVFHPAFGYLFERCGIVQRVIETGGREPTGRHLGAVIRWAKARNVRTVFVQPQFSTSSAGVIARALGGSVVPLEPLPAPYLAGMRHVAAQLKRGLTE